VTNRTLERARRMADTFRARSSHLTNFTKPPSQADIVIQLDRRRRHPIFPAREHGQEFLRRRPQSPMFFIDICRASRRGPGDGQAGGHLLSMTLTTSASGRAHMANAAARPRTRALIAARSNASISAAHGQCGSGDCRLQRQAEEIRQRNSKRAQTRLGLLSAEQIAAVESLTRGLVNKFLHPPNAGAQAGCA